jgi:hypothetical protein
MRACRVTCNYEMSELPTADLGTRFGIRSLEKCSNRRSEIFFGFRKSSFGRRRSCGVGHNLVVTKDSINRVVESTNAAYGRSCNVRGTCDYGMCDVVFESNLVRVTVTAVGNSPLILDESSDHGLGQRYEDIWMQSPGNLPGPGIIVPKTRQSLARRYVV